MKEIEKEQILEEFGQKIITNQEDMPVEFVNIVNENFWELLL